MQTPEDASVNYELLSPIGYANSSRCGYCGAKGQSFSYYSNATSLSPCFYQTLVDRCWRRSGKLLYRPDQRRSCCPHYTIRLDSSQFKPSRDQRQTVNRFNKFVLGESYIKEAARLYPRTRQETKKRANEFSLVDRVHEAEYGNLKTPPEPAHRLVITLEEDNFTEEKYQVYNNYQRIVHKDPPEERTPRAFKRFLCNSPLRREVMAASDGRKRKLGSYHQCYRLDGILVAIGVLDLLPNCVSSVYFLYHESIHKQAPGKLSAMHEIALASEEGYHWWYPGFYIHNCPKMKYKIDYSPQFILDPESLTWDPLDQTVLALLDQKPFLSLFLEKRKSIAAQELVSVDGHGSSDKPKVSDGGRPGTPTNDTDTKGNDAEGEATEDGNDDEALQSLFRSSMPGIRSMTEMLEVNLDHIALKMTPNGPLFETSDLVAWESHTIADWPGIKAFVAELIAAIGPDACELICLDMTRR